MLKVEEEYKRDYKQITSGHLLVIKIMQPWERNKNAFRDNRTNPKYSAYIKHSLYSTFRKYIELSTMMLQRGIIYAYAYLAEVRN